MLNLGHEEPKVDNGEGEAEQPKVAFLGEPGAETDGGEGLVFVREGEAFGGPLGEVRRKGRGGERVSTEEKARSEKDMRLTRAVMLTRLLGLPSDWFEACSIRCERTRNMSSRGIRRSLSSMAFMRLVKAKKTGDQYGKKSEQKADSLPNFELELILGQALAMEDRLALLGGSEAGWAKEDGGGEQI